MKDKPGLTDLQKRTQAYTFAGAAEEIRLKLIERKIGHDQALKELRSLASEFIKDTDYKYDSEFGDLRFCQCGHYYYRHFDTYEDMAAVGCKYCHCQKFVEKD